MSRQFLKLLSALLLAMPGWAMAESVLSREDGHSQTSTGLGFRVVIPRSIYLSLAVAPGAAGPSAVVQGQGNVRALWLTATADETADEHVLGGSLRKSRWALGASAPRGRNSQDASLAVRNTRALSAIDRRLTYTLASP